MSQPLNHQASKPSRTAKLTMLSIEASFSLFSFMAALLVTGHFELLRSDFSLVGSALGILVLLRTIAFYGFRTYLITAQGKGKREMYKVFMAVSLSSAAFGLAVLFYPSLLPEQSALAILLADYIVLLALYGGFRGVLRLAAYNMRDQARDEGNSKLNVSQLKDIEPEDWLDRPNIQLDQTAIQGTIAGKTVLITGCAGSVGREILKQCLGYRPHLLLGVDTAEKPLADVNQAFQNHVKAGRLLLFTINVRDETGMEKLFKTHQPDYVFHAAAYKQVPMMERFPEEAVKSNVLGTLNLARLASAYDAERFVMISTNKAAKPSSVMAASKRIAEIYVQALHYRPGNNTRFITTRFGNVLGSNGSVVPVFQKQIEERQPVTVTHPDITRVFTAITDVSQLILQAGAIGRGGEVFVFDIGSPIRIADLAKKMIQMAGLTPGQDIDIVYIGLRPGEKLYEEALGKEESHKPTRHPNIKKAEVRHRDYDTIIQPIQRLIQAAEDDESPHSIVLRMKRLVPEFISANSEFSTLDEDIPKEEN